MKPDLAELVSKWQRLLRLQDWRLQVQYTADLDMDGAPVHGLCSRNVDAKRAFIQIRDPETPATQNDPSVEDVLIHELLHLHLAPLSGVRPAEIAAEEQAVWAIAEAIARGSGREAQMIARAMAAHAGARREGMPTTKEIADVARACAEACTKCADACETGTADECIAACAECQAACKACADACASMGGGGAPAGDTPPAAAQAAPPAPQDDKPPMAQRAARPAAPAAPAPRATVPASTLVTRHEFAELTKRLERDRIERMLDKRQDLTDAQRAHALALPTAELAEGFLKVTPAATAAPGATPTARAQRGMSPTQGASRATQTGDAELNEIRRRMGTLERNDEAAVKIDRSGRLTISSLRPVRLADAAEPARTGAQKGGE